MQNEAKWVRPIDWVIWIGILVVVIMINRRMEDFSYKDVYYQLSSEAQNLPQIIEEVNQYMNKDNRDMRLTDIELRIPGKDGAYDQAEELQLLYSVRRKQMIGHGISQVCVTIDMENNILETISTLYFGNMYAELPEVNKITIPKLVNIISKRIDLEKASRYYEPRLIIRIDNYNQNPEKASVYVSLYYYTKLDEHGYDWDSSVSESTEFPLKELINSSE